MNPWVIVMIVLMAMSLTIGAVKHGEPQSNHNFFTSLIATGILWFILYMAGFFSL